MYLSLGSVDKFIFFVFLWQGFFDVIWEALGGGGFGYPLSEKKETKKKDYEM